MDFYKILKYVLFVVLFGIIAIGGANMKSDSSVVQQPAVQPSQSKFNL